MPTIDKVTDIVEEVRTRLAEAEALGVHLKVSRHKLDDDWLYVVVEPARPGIRASDYANFMAKVERELRAEGNDQVLLVPELAD